MAFRATTILKKNAYDSLRAIANQVKRRAEIILPLLDSDITRENVLEYGQTLENQRLQLIEFESTDLLQWAKDQEEDQTYNVELEYAAMKAAILAVLTEIRTSYPTSGGFLATKQFSAPNTLALTEGTFTPAQVQDLKTAVQALINTIA